eukprot:scaffold176933_cov26-Tisochrysis_lutea.AAC.1
MHVRVPSPFFCLLSPSRTTLRSAWSLHTWCTEFIHAVHGACTRGAQSLHTWCTELMHEVHGACTHSAQSLHTWCAEPALLGTQSLHTWCTDNAYLVHGARSAERAKTICTWVSCI